MATDWHTYLRLRSIIPATVIGATAFTICSQSAMGFFPPVPNGPNTVVEVPPTTPPVNPPTTPPTTPPTVPPVVVPPVSPPPVIPPVPPPPFVPPVVPPTVPPPCTCPPPVVRPVETPEPATFVMGAIGLAVAAAARRKKLGAKE